MIIMDLTLGFMEQEQLKNNTTFIKVALFILVSSLLYSSCSFDDDIDLGGGYFYVQDAPQCIICRYPKSKIVVPMGDCEEMVVRVQYNDSYIIATCAKTYYENDSTIYIIDKATKEIQVVSDSGLHQININNNYSKGNYKDVKNYHRYYGKSDSFWTMLKYSLGLI